MIKEVPMTWHLLKDDPEDLPEENCYCDVVLFHKNDKIYFVDHDTAYFDSNKRKWHLWHDIIEDYVPIDDPMFYVELVGWCKAKDWREDVLAII